MLASGVMAQVHPFWQWKGPLHPPLGRDLARKPPMLLSFASPFFLSTLSFTVANSIRRTSSLLDKAHRSGSSSLGDGASVKQASASRNGVEGAVRPAARCANPRH